MRVTTLAAVSGGLLVGVGSTSFTRIAVIDDLEGSATIRFVARTSGDALAVPTESGALVLARFDATSWATLAAFELDGAGAPTRAFRLGTLSDHILLHGLANAPGDEVLVSVSEGDPSGDGRTATVLRLAADRTVRWQRSVLDRGLGTQLGSDADGTSYLALAIPPKADDRNDPKGDIALVALDDAGDLAYQWRAPATSYPTGLSVVGTTVFVHGSEYERGRARWAFSATEAHGCGGRGLPGPYELMDGTVTLTPEPELPPNESSDLVTKEGQRIAMARTSPAATPSWLSACLSPPQRERSAKPDRARACRTVLRRRSRRRSRWSP